MIAATTLIAGLIASLELGAQPGIGVEAIRRTPEDDLLATVGGITGPGAKDCGRLMQPGTWGQPAYDREHLAPPLQCAVDAAGERQPSIVVLKSMGFDSWTASGLLSDSSGQLMFFTYDNVYGQGTLRTRACRTPISKVNPDGFVYIDCTQ